MPHNNGRLRDDNIKKVNERVPTPIPSMLKQSASEAIKLNTTKEKQLQQQQEDADDDDSDNSSESVLVVEPSSGTILTVGGRYQINLKLDKMGSGGFGTVWKAFDTTNGELVAIKHIHNSGKTGAAKHKLREIRNEIRLMQRLDSEYVVRYIDHIEMHPHGLFIVMELLEGSLAGLVKRYRPISEHMVAKYTAQILRALHYLHINGIIHRDIKADNVLYTKSSQLKLADFGIAQTLAQVRPDHVAGSPYWMAPEVVMMTGADFKSDIWSLGCLVIELLTGKPPYFDLDPVQAFFRIVNDGSPPIPKGVSQTLYDFLMKCFNKQPELRKSAQELLSHPWIMYGVNNDAPCPLSPHQTSTKISSSVREVRAGTPDGQVRSRAVDSAQFMDSDTESDDYSSSDFSDSSSWGYSSNGSDSDDGFQPVTVVIGRKNRPAIQVIRAESPISTDSGERSASPNSLKRPGSSGRSRPSTPTDRKSRTKTSVKSRLSRFREDADDDDDDDDDWFDFSDSDNQSSGSGKSSLNLELRLGRQFNSIDSDDFDLDSFDDIDGAEIATFQELRAMERERELIDMIRGLESISATHDSVVESLDSIMVQLQQDSPDSDQDGALLSQYLPIPVLELLTSDRLAADTVVFKVLQLLNHVIQGNKALQEKLCLIGIFSLVCRFADPRFSIQVRAEACQFLYKMIRESSRNLQTFIQCGSALPSLILFLQHETERPLDDPAVRRTISHTLQIIIRILNFKSATIHTQAIQNTQRNDFCRLMVAFNYVEHILATLSLAAEALRLYDSCTSTDTSEDDCWDDSDSSDSSGNMEDHAEREIDALVTEALNIFLTMSYGDSIVKMDITKGDNVRQLIALASHWSSRGNHKLILMQCFRNLCSDARTQENITRNGMIEFTVRELEKVIDDEDVHDSRTTVCKIYGMLLTIMHNLCAYIDTRKEQLVSVDGAMELIITIITRNLKLSEEIAAHLFFGIGFAKSDIARRAFVVHGGLECLFGMMRSSVLKWRVNGLLVLVELLSSETVAEAVETFLLRPGRSTVLLRIMSSEGVNSSGHTIIRVLLAPLNSLMLISDSVAQVFSGDDAFLTRLVAFMKHELADPEETRHTSSKDASRHHVLDARFIKEMLTTIETLFESQESDDDRMALIERHRLVPAVRQALERCESNQFHIPAQIASELLEKMERICPDCQKK